MDAKYEEVNLGANICEKIKTIFYPDTHWSKCYGEVARQLNKLKSIGRKFYCDMDDIEILKQLIRYSTDDIKDAFENGQQYISNTAGPDTYGITPAQADAKCDKKANPSRSLPDKTITA